MKTIEEFLSELNHLQVKLWLENKQLHYKAPKGALSSALRTELIERKAEIIAFIAKQQEATLPPIVPISRKQPLPLSYAQQRLWFLNQLEGQENTTYNMPAAVRLAGDLNLEALKQSLREIVQRHETLRTVFPMKNGEPVVQLSMNNHQLPMRDLTALPKEKQKLEIQRLLDEETKRSFDLFHRPLFRTYLLQLSVDSHILLVTMHHIISDGWSIGVLIHELSILYEAFSKKQRSPLPPLPIQYIDFAYWQRQWLTHAILERQIKYWQQQLAGSPALLELPTDYPRPAIKSFRGNSQTFEVPQPISQHLIDLGEQHHVTLFMTLLAAFVVLLNRYTGQEDIVVGTPIANRNRSEIEPLIGFFVNTLVLRTQLSGNACFTELLTQIEKTCLDAYDHQDVPFEQLVDALQLERNLSHTPLFQVMFVLQNTPNEQLQLSGLTMTHLPLEQLTAKFDLLLSIEETPQGLLGYLEYNTDLFKADTIERMIGHFQTLLAGIVAQSTQTIAHLPLFTESEKHQLLVEWNKTVVTYPEEQCLHQLFEAQVERTPDSIAVVFEKQQLSYATLNQKANQLAHYLQVIGVKPEVLVGLCVERSLEMIVGLLGILKAGGAYIPLEPTLPNTRLAFMLKEAQPSVLLTLNKFLKKLPSSLSAPVICLDTFEATLSSLDMTNPVNGVMPFNLAYVIYTSGSTGQPKGVMNTHRGICNRLLWMQEAYQLTNTDKVLQKTPFSFDVSVWEFFWPLLVGAHLVVAKPGGHQDNAYLIEMIIEQKITTLHFVPSMLQMFIQEQALEKVTSLKRVICSGEALPFELQERFFAHCQAQLHNLYGPTEAAVDVSYWSCQRESNLTKVPIGRPIANIQLYILDRHQQNTPIGVPGELHIGGVGLARGYLNRPDLTAEKFIPNPFSEVPNARLYQTGDLVRYLPEGQIEYLGRLDNQIKLRGFRIELGEIEVALMRHQAVRETVVTLQKDSHNHQYLVAYVVPNPTTVFTTTDLRQFLKNQLPDYMVPATLMTLESLPLTAHGKVDYRALPRPERGRNASTAIFAVPNTLEEELLANIWSEVLDIEAVSRYDNFFEFGGDSILSIKVLALVKKAGFNLSLQQLFQAQTLYELAQLLQQTEKTEKNSLLALPKIQAFTLISEEERQKLPEAVEDAYPLSVLQAGMIFHSNYSPDTVSVYHDVFSYYLRVPFDVQRLQQAIQQIVNLHPILRTSFVLTSFKEPLQLVYKTIDIPLMVADLCHLSSTEQETAIQVWIAEEKKRPFDWHHPPLWRLQIHCRSIDTFNLTFSFHHAIFDGWSVASLMTELLQNYLSLLGKEILPPPAPAINFRDFIALEQLTLQSEDARQFWLNTLTDITILKLPRWPTSYHTPQVNEIGVLDVPLSEEISNGLKQLAKSLNVPIRSVLLAAHLRVLSVLGNQTDIMTGLVSNGRLEDKDGERVLGLFLNTLPFRLTLQGDTWRELITETFKVERAALPYRRFPLAEIQRMLGGQPLFETAFNFTHFHVYQGILGLKEVEALGGQFFEQTHFTLLTSFSLDLLTLEVNLTLNYDTGELCEEQIQAIAGYYTQALTAMATNASARYECHSLLSDSECQQLLIEWNNTVADYPQNQCIHHLFEAQVKRTPEAIAVEFENQSLSYAALNQKANQLAHYLQSLGVNSDMLVGIYLDRSLEMSIGLLAILKSGGAYLPLDPTYPAARLVFMLEDAQVTVLITKQNLLHKLPSSQAKTVCLDTNDEMLSQLTSENPNSQVIPSNLAYVIYTSGTTGKPKGVMMAHRPLVNLLWWHQQHAILKCATRTLQFTSLNFDVSFQEIFTTWCVGGTLVLLSEETRKEPLALLNFLIEHSIERFFLPFIVLQQLAEVSENQMLLPTTLSDVITAGEQLRITHVIANFFNRLPTCTLHNHYGPTESHVVTALTLPKSVTHWSNLPPIGRPIANTLIYLLNDYMQPVPIGVPGELHIGGAGLARSYLDRHEITQEKFIPNPFNNNSEAQLLYKTGDLARYLPDGQIEYLGRLDNQVKIRGFRIELGEIEAVLAQHLAVRESVVIVHEISSNDKRLIAYLVLNEEKDFNNNMLRSFLAQQLPDYMIPSAFIRMETMPLTPNGKIDRRILSQLEEFSYCSPENNFVAPRNIEEEALAKIWASVLGRERVGIFDNFFELGGHSLLATQLMLRIREVFFIEFSLHHLFESPTIAEIAQIIQMKDPEKTAIDINHEAILDSSIQPLVVSIERCERFAIPKSILLTGATGFLGAYLLYELLLQTTADIYCLVRCSNIPEGQQRLKKTLESYSLWNETFCSRIIPVAGDLSEPQLGITEPEFHDLANQIDVIYHNGAWVHHIYPYSVLKTTNVLGTQEVLKLACMNKVKPLHFISTIGVFFSKPEAGIENSIVGESDFIEDGNVLDENGYIQSKWVAEQLVRQAGERGLPICIYRLARIGGHSQTGISNSSDFLSLAIKSCIQLGKVPIIDDSEENITPVDYVSHAIVYLSQQTQLLGKTFHLINPQPILLSQLIEWVRSLGYSLEPVSYIQWLSELSSQPENALYSFLSLFPQEHSNENTVAVPQFNCQKTFEELMNSQIVCPPIDTQLFQLYFSYFWKSNFLEPPL